MKSKWEMISLAHWNANDWVLVALSGEGENHGYKELPKGPTMVWYRQNQCHAVLITVALCNNKFRFADASSNVLFAQDYFVRMWSLILTCEF